MLETTTHFNLLRIPHPNRTTIYYTMRSGNMRKGQSKEYLPGLREHRIASPESCVASAPRQTTPLSISASTAEHPHFENSSSRRRQQVEQ